MLLRQTHVTDRNRIPRAPIRSCLALMLLCGVMQSASAGVNCQPLDLPPISAFESGGTSSYFSVFTAQTPAVGGADPDYFDFMFFNAGTRTPERSTWALPRMTTTPPANAACNCARM